jgi:lipid II:glycine glycyltransferase (peptidoglycan interpeptide bridge formation enzyme)
MITKNLKRLAKIGKAYGVKYDDATDLFLYGIVKIKTKTLKEVYRIIGDYDLTFKEVIIYEQYERGYYRDGTKFK